MARRTSQSINYTRWTLNALHGEAASLQRQMEELDTDRTPNSESKDALIASLAMQRSQVLREIGSRQTTRPSYKQRSA